MTNDERRLYSAEQVAELLGLHVRTVRGYVRDGRLRAVRIGKQYRIAHEDLAALTGRPAPDPPAGGAVVGGAVVDGAVVGGRTVEVTSVVHIDGVDRLTADRVSTHLVAAAQAPRDDPDALRLQTVYDPARARLKVVVLGGASVTADVLHTLGALLGTEHDG